MKYVLTISLLVIALLTFFFVQGTGKTSSKDTPFGDSLDYYIVQFENVIDVYKRHDLNNPHEFDNYNQEGVMYNFPSYIRPNYGGIDSEMKRARKIIQVDSLVSEGKAILAKKDVYAFHDFMRSNWKHFVFHPANNLQNEQNLIDMMLVISRECYPKEQTLNEGIEYYEWYLKHLSLTEVYHEGRVRKTVELNPRRPLATFSLMEFYRMKGELNRSVQLGEELVKDVRIAMPDDADLMRECATELLRYYQLANEIEKADKRVEKYKLQDFI